MNVRTNELTAEKKPNHWPKGTGAKCALFLVAGLFSSLPARANTITAATCSQADVTAAYNSAVEGDTVKVPGPCSVSWNGLTISGKAITLDGGGNVTVTSTTAIMVQSTVTASSRVTGFLFTGPGNINLGVIGANGGSTFKPWRIDHNVFTNDNPTGVTMYNNSPGLFDHNTVTFGAAAEFIHNFARGSSNGNQGWTDDVLPGSAALVYIEDNDLTCTSNTTVCSMVQGYYGSRTVVRHNQMHGAVLIDMHGTCGNVYARWWEVYENTWTVSPGTNQYAYIGMRGGSGVIWNNHIVSPGNNSGGAGIKFIEDCTSGSYPITDQIGRGINQAYSPVYAWNNDPSMIYANQGTFVHNNDVFTSSSQPATMIRCELAADGGSPGTDSCPTTYSYVPYTYPHPLQGSGPPPPSGLADVVH